jgi:hypothetical protein
VALRLRRVLEADSVAENAGRGRDGPRGRHAKGPAPRRRPARR